MTAIGGCVLIAEISAQQSASGLGVLTDLDAVFAPATDVDSAAVFCAAPAPYGIAQLSSATILAGVPSVEMSAWISGYGSADHSRISLGARKPWTIGRGFSIGVRAECSWMLFRGFANSVDLRFGGHVLTHQDEWTFGVSIDDVVVVGVEPLPWLRCSVGYSTDDLGGAFDVIMNGAQEIAVMLTGRWAVVPHTTMVGSVLTSPLTIRLEAMFDAIDPVDVVVGIQHVEELGISPRISVRWPW